MKKVTYSIWKEEIVVRLKRGIEYTSLGIRNGHSDQRFSSDDLPEQLVCQCWGKVIKEGQIYEIYVPKEYVTPKITLKGKKGWLNWEEEANNICQIFQGVTDDGRKISQSRCLTVEDINQYLSIKVDHGKLEYYSYDLIDLRYDQKHSKKIYFGENYLLASNAIERFSNCMLLLIRSVCYDCITATSTYRSNTEVTKEICYGIRPVFLIEE